MSWSNGTDVTSCLCVCVWTEKECAKHTVLKQRFVFPLCVCVICVIVVTLQYSNIQTIVSRPYTETQSMDQATAAGKISL